MNVYGIFEEEEKFVNFEMDIFLNLQKIVSIFKVEIHYETKFNDVFQSVKQELVQQDLYMNESDDHHFVYINSNGQEEQLFHWDWNQLVKDLDIFSFDEKISQEVARTKYLFQTLKLEQTYGRHDTNQYKVEKMIGIKKDYMIAVIPNEEFLLFQESSKRLCVDSNRSTTLEEILLMEHPIEMNNIKKSSQGSINITVNLENSDIRLLKRGTLKPPVCIKSLVIQPEDKVSAVLKIALSKFEEWSDRALRPEDYLFRIAEREEYLVSLDNVEIIKFQYINSCVQMNISPNLIIVQRSNLERIYRVPQGNQLGRDRKFQNLKGANSVNENAFIHNSMSKKKFIYIHDLWKQFKKSSCTNSNEENVLTVDNNNNLEESFEHVFDSLEHTDLLYVVRVSSIDYPNSCLLQKDQKVIIITGLYHGEKSLCADQFREWTSDTTSCDIVFPIEIWNLPRMARLCFALTVVKLSFSLKDFSSNPQKKFIGWGNLMIYDHQSILRIDTITYRLWSNVRPSLNPTGSVYSNPDGHLITPAVTVQLLPKLTNFKKIVYPPMEILISEAGKMLGNDSELDPSVEEREKIAEILARSSLDDIMEDEQNILWKYRYHIRNFYQDSLPRILNTRPWNNFENVAKMQHVVCGWPIDKEIIMVLELLGPEFPDCDIRMKAVDSLLRINWQEFSRYMLQICQCLKYESYLNSNLTQTIVKKMASNAKIAQSMFYYLKVEISACEWCKVPFSIILYNYLQYSPDRCNSLLKQFRAMTEICQYNKNIMQFNSLEGERKDRVLKNFRESLTSPANKEIFEDLTCPLDCNIRLKTLKSEACKFMDSKMRPIRMNWNVNVDFAKDYLLIYKNGDDLRQDGLIVQMLHIMDSIWQGSGLDLKLNPYDVLACSKTEGFIQVVQRSETLANIYRQSKNKTSKLFFNWLKSKNHESNMKAVVKNFTRSCAAYCVATFILGIGDRHSDNIMITEDGQFFHIDYGHVLGNFKRFMGGMVSREWTKFILVQDFLDIVAAGDVEKELEFKKLCSRGYIALRKYSNLILSLFKIMVNAGIPEISSMDDLNYLKDTLQIGKSDEEAESYFQNVYDDTRKKEMFVSLNWVAHNMKRNNN